jgi:hypothetical protein
VSWIPGRRRARQAIEEPYEDVPDHLVREIWDWVQSAIVSMRSESETQIRLRMISVELRLVLPGREWTDIFDALGRKCFDDRSLMLDVVELVLERLDPWVSKPDVLAAVLVAGNSAYAVRDDGHGLELRLAVGVRNAITETARHATGSAGEHLTAAWNAAYGRKTDAPKAYSESIKAVEAATARLVSPNNAKQTLGTMIRDVSAKPSKWKFAVADANGDGVATILRMMRILWDGQTSRHGGLVSTRSETIVEARAAVHIAVALVQFATSKAFDVA